MSDTECPMCASTSIVQLTSTDKLYYGQCQLCAFEFSTVEQLEATQKQATARIALDANLFSPAEIKAIRDQHGLLQREFELALGVGKKTVVRWEGGSVPPSGAANSLLWIAKNESVAFRRLAARNGVSVSKSYSYAGEWNIALWAAAPRAAASGDCAARQQFTSEKFSQFEPTDIFAEA